MKKFFKYGVITLISVIILFVIFTINQGFQGYGMQKLPSSETLTVGQPEGGLTVTPLSGIAPLKVTFTYPMEKVILTDGIILDFGDGSQPVSYCTGTSHDCGIPNSTMHTYSTPGTYFATLKTVSGENMGSVKVAVTAK